jgi:hypothetical protein
MDLTIRHQGGPMAIYLTPRTLRWVAEHHGVITTQVLREHGVGPDATTRLVQSGLLRRVARGVFVAATSPATVEQRCVVLSASHRGGFVTGPTAGCLAGLRRMPRMSALHYSVPHGIHLPDDPGVRFRQTTVIWATDRRTRDDGIVVASWPRLAFDLAADLRQLDHVSVVQQLLHDKRVTVDDLMGIDRRLGHPARPGSGRFRQTMASLTGSAPNESHPEVVLADALRRRGVPIEHQTRVMRPSSGRAARIDLAVPDVRWGIELDIHPEHRTVEGAGSDARRRRDMHGATWQVEPVTELDMLDVERLADELVELYRGRRVELTRRPSVS